MKSALPIADDFFLLPPPSSLRDRRKGGGALHLPTFSNPPTPTTQLLTGRSPLWPQKATRPGENFRVRRPNPTLTEVGRKENRHAIPKSAPEIEKKKSHHNHTDTAVVYQRPPFSQKKRAFHSPTSSLPPCRTVMHGGACIPHTRGGEGGRDCIQRCQNGNTKHDTKLAQLRHSIC